MDLDKEHCVPCKSGKGKLTENEIKELLKEVPGWNYDEGRLVRTWRFENFREAFDFVQRVSNLAEREGHHPDITFGWGYATVILRTHSLKGLSRNDFIMAGKINSFFIA